MKFKDQAIHEAIYWWCRDEYFLHQVLSNFDNEITTLGKQFVEEKVIGYFLRLYSVRRTIQKGEEGVTKFTRELSSTGFYKCVMEDDCEALEEFASQFSSATEGSIKSALSKLATLCNPSKFVMFDSRSRRGMHRIYNGFLKDKITYEQIDDYNHYTTLSARLAEYFPEEFSRPFVCLASLCEYCVEHPCDACHRSYVRV